MKYSLFGAFATVFLFGFNTHAQEVSREELRSLEEETALLTSDTNPISFDRLKAKSRFDWVAIQTFQSIDTLLLFVNTIKQDKSASFEDDVIPILEAKSDNPIPDFNEDEKLIYDSFLKVLRWDKTMETVALYEAFILRSNSKELKFDSVLIVLSFLKNLYSYIDGKKDVQNSPVYNCILENFISNNEVDWMVFSLHPIKLILWTVAACAWNIKTEK